MYKEQLQRYKSFKNLVKYYDQKLAAGIAKESGVDFQESRSLCEAKIEAVERAVEGIADPTERLLLRLRYMEGKSWTQVGFALHYSPSSVKRIHKRALEHLKEVRS